MRIEEARIIESTLEIKFFQSCRLTGFPDEILIAVGWLDTAIDALFVCERVQMTACRTRRICIRWKRNPESTTRMNSPLVIQFVCPEELLVLGGGSWSFDSSIGVFCRNPAQVN